MGYSWPGVFLLGARGRTGRFLTQLLFQDYVFVFFTNLAVCYKVYFVKTTIKASDTLKTNPLSGQHLTHARSHITRAVAAMDNCFGLVRPHQHGIAVGQK